MPKKQPNRKSRPNMPLPPVSNMEHSTILAALRFYQEALTRDNSMSPWILDIATNARLHPILSPLGIDALCRRINTETSSKEARPDPYACLTEEQKRRIREVAIEFLISDILGDKDNPRFWAQYIVKGWGLDQCLEQISDVVEKQAEELGFNPDTGQPWRNPHDP